MWMYIVPPALAYATKTQNQASWNRKQNDRQNPITPMLAL